MIWNWLAAAVMILTALGHATGGARSVLGPLLSSGNVSDADAILLRFTWYGLAAMMVLSAVTVVWTGVPRSLVGFIGVSWLALAVIDIVTSRFAHPGWIPMGIAGSLCLVAVFVSRG